MTPEQEKLLIEIAWRSIFHGLEKRSPLPVSRNLLDAVLLEKRATFVTLHSCGGLRGCIGAIDPVRPLAEDVSHHAFAAAFRDPRFAPVTLDEYQRLSLSISVLSSRQYLEFDSEAELLEKLRPGTDGLVLEEGFHCGTFLPVMWEQLPEKAEFLRHLKRKAGLSPGHWSKRVRVSRFCAEHYLKSPGPGAA